MHSHILPGPPPSTMAPTKPVDRFPNAAAISASVGVADTLSVRTVQAMELRGSSPINSALDSEPGPSSAGTRSSSRASEARPASGPPAGFCSSSARLNIGRCPNCALGGTPRMTVRCLDCLRSGSLSGWKYRITILRSHNRRSRLGSHCPRCHHRSDAGSDLPSY